MKHQGRWAIHVTSWCLLALAHAADGPSASQIRRAAEAVTKDADVQGSLPNDSGRADAPLTRRDRDPFGFSAGEGVYIPGADAIVGLAQWAFLVVSAITLLAVVAMILREPFQARLRPAAAPAFPMPDAPRAPADPRELLARADDLAAGGRFAEAMHCVLLAAMVLATGADPDPAADSRTSWELLRSAPLQPPQRSALRELVVRVERAWFGQFPAGADDYRHVRGSFDAFAAAGAPETA